MIIVRLFLQPRAVRVDTGTGTGTGASVDVDVALTAVSIAREEVLPPPSMQFITNINHNGDRKLKESKLSDGFGFGFAPQNEQGGTRALSSTSRRGFRRGFSFLSKTPSVMATATTIAVTRTTLITMTLVRRGRVRVDMVLCFRHGRRTCHV